MAKSKTTSKRNARHTMKVTHNITISKPRWEFIHATCGWAHGDIKEVVAVRFGPDGTFLGRASCPTDGDKYRGTTELSVEYVTQYRQFRRIVKTIDKKLRWISEASLTQYWGRMITAAKEWP